MSELPLTPANLVTQTCRARNSSKIPGHTILNLRLEEMELKRIRTSEYFHRTSNQRFLHIINIYSANINSCGRLPLKGKKIKAIVRYHSAILPAANIRKKEKKKQSKVKKDNWHIKLYIWIY